MKKWKRMFAAACAGVICAVGMPLTGMSEYLPEVGIMASAEDSYTYDVFTYTYLDDGTIQITDCDAENLDVKIPREINGTAVTAVDFSEWWTDVTSIDIPDTIIDIKINRWSSGAIIRNITVSEDNTAYSSEDGVLFDKDKTTLICYPRRKTETSYQIPNSVTSIGNDAFWHCGKLESITIPDSVTSIGNSAFRGTPWLAARQEENPLVIVNGILIEGTTCSGDITIPDGVTSICDNAFWYCTDLKNITIGGSVTNIGKQAFDCCENLESVTIEGNVTSIGDLAFENCTRLESVTIGNNVTSIGSFAFRKCTSLQSVTIGNRVTSIGLYVFENCTSLECVIIEDGATNIGFGSFHGCTGLQSVTIGYGMKSIDGYAFKDCINIESIVIPDDVMSIGVCSFADCTSLTSITIPNSVTKVCQNAFNSCETLSDVYFDGTSSEWDAITIDNEDGGNNPLLLATIHFSDGTTKGLKTGDLDNDGKITMTDAYQALIASSKVALGEDDGLTAVQFRAADVDGSGRLTMTDAYWILIYSSYSYIGEEITWEELLG